MTVRVALMLLLVPAISQAQQRDRAAERTSEVVLLKRTGVLAYEEVAEAFNEHCRVVVRPVLFDGRPESVAEARRRARTAHLVVAVGQPAVDVAQGTTAPVVYALAPDPSPGAVGADLSAPPEVAFRALLQARPRVQRIGTISGKRGAARLDKARAAASALGLKLVERQADTGPQAILMLRDLVFGDPPVDALWIGADPQLVTLPVFHYLLQLQLQNSIPVLAATRQQVRSGALIAADWGPSGVGHRLAAQVNLVLEGQTHTDLSGREDPAGLPQVTLNSLMARKLGIDVDARRAAGWRIE